MDLMGGAGESGALKICVVSSGGGHLRQILQLQDILKRYRYFFVINNPGVMREEMAGRTYVISRSERDWKFALNLMESFKILAKERPDVILSTGAGCAVPVSVIGKFFFGCRVIYIETFAAVYGPTLTGRIMYLIADRFLYQWEMLARFFPKGIYAGSIY